MEFPFKFNEIKTFAKDGRVSAEYIDTASGAYIQLNHDIDNFDEILRNLKKALRAAKKQVREENRFQKWLKRHREIEANQD